MKLIKTELRRYPYFVAPDIKIAATLGNFDGIHIGHQSLLVKLAEHKKRGLKTALISFYPHPAVVLGKAAKIPILTALSKKIRILNSFNLDYLFLIHFTKNFSKISAEQFLADIVLGMFNVSCLLIGEDARVGAKGEGDAKYISDFCARSGCEVTILEHVKSCGERVSSRALRDAVLSGDMSKYKALSAGYFSLIGKVMRGKGIGKNIGYPTANLHLREEYIVPASGVYASLTHKDGVAYKSVCNVGYRPTFAGTSLSVESHLIDYKGADFYGTKVEIEFIEKIRGELSFSSSLELSKQIGFDIETALKIL